MPDINSGLPLKFENGGTVELYDVAGSTAYNVLLIEPGTVRWKPGFNQKIVYKDRGTLATTPLVGSEMPGMLSFTARMTKNGLTGATDLFTVARPGDTSGYARVIKIVFKVPGFRGASTGSRATLENCFMPEPPEYTASGEGEDFDTMAFEFTCLDSSVVIDTY